MLGVNALNAGDYLSVVGYLAGGLAGQTIAMRYSRIIRYFRNRLRL
jgi:hypothetical protein